MHCKITAPLVSSGFMAQLVRALCIGIAEVVSLNPIEAQKKVYPGFSFTFVLIIYTVV